MKTQVRKLTQIALMLFVFSMMLPQLKAQTIGSQIRIGADSTISYWNGTAWIAVVPGLPGQSLRFTNGIPAWIDFPVTDYDGNVYDVVTIGTQRWMKQNLKTTHYRNGDAISNVTDASSWSALSTDAYCNYNNDVSNSTTYGRLYNWYTVVDSRNLCPTGWHMPNIVEWTNLTTYLGGEDIAGDKLKEAGLTHWNNPNSATNETGFTALPAGHRNFDGAFYLIGNDVHFWSSSEHNIYNDKAMSCYSYYNVSFMSTGGSYKTHGFSIRCLKD